MTPECDPQEVLRTLVARTRVNSFSVVKPSLHDIFIRIAGPAAEEGPVREVHLAFAAADRAAVDAFHAAAVAAGAESLHAPRLWPAYHESYYGAFVRDPDGNNIEAVCHTA